MIVIQVVAVPTARFQLGAIALTPGALGLYVKGVDLGELIVRHWSGDWGDLDEADKAENEFAIDKHLRIMSAYETEGGRIWIITEADRSVTTLLLPSEY